MRKRLYYGASTPLTSSQSQAGTCCVERACAAFHEAHDAIVARTCDSEEVDAGEHLELRARRASAFDLIRARRAWTKDAWKAKMRVLTVIRDWFTLDNPMTAAFAMDVALEAAALLDSDPSQACPCEEAGGGTCLALARAAERRNPLAWFVRPWGSASDKPFAS